MFASGEALPPDLARLYFERMPGELHNLQSNSAYDAVMALRPDYANRVSYVIAPNGKVIYNYQSLNPSRHVEKTLAALVKLV